MDTMAFRAEGSTFAALQTPIILDENVLKYFFPGARRMKGHRSLPVLNLSDLIKNICHVVYICLFSRGFTPLLLSFSATGHLNVLFTLDICNEIIYKL